MATEILRRIVVTESTYEVIWCAKNGAEAIMHCNHSVPDLILMDINLPGMDGYEALKQLQFKLDTQNIPVFAISANAMEKDIKMGEKAGFCAYITKPLDVAELIREIDKAVDV